MVDGDDGDDEDVGRSGVGVLLGRKGVTEQVVIFLSAVSPPSFPHLPEYIFSVQMHTFQQLNPSSRRYHQSLWFICTYTNLATTDRSPNERSFFHPPKFKTVASEVPAITITCTHRFPFFLIFRSSRGAKKKKTTKKTSGTELVPLMV